MDKQQADITADLTEEQIWKTAASAKGDPFRAVAAMARKGWRPIPKDEGFPMTLHQPRSNPCRLVVPAAEGEAQQLAQQLHELASILESLQIPQWPGRVLRAAELLGQQQALAPVLTLPTIHLNGTEAKRLLYEYIALAQAIENATAALERATCNARDFYPQGDHAFNCAKYERTQMFQKLKDLQEYASAWAVQASKHIRTSHQPKS